MQNKQFLFGQLEFNPIVTAKKIPVLNSGHNGALPCLKNKKDQEI